MNPNEAPTKTTTPPTASSASTRKTLPAKTIAAIVVLVVALGFIYLRTPIAAYLARGESIYDAIGVTTAKSSFSANDLDIMGIKYAEYCPPSSCNEIEIGSAKVKIDGKEARYPKQLIEALGKPNLILQSFYYSSSGSFYEGVLIWKLDRAYVTAGFSKGAEVTQGDFYLNGIKSSISGFYVFPTSVYSGEDVLEFFPHSFSRKKYEVYGTLDID